MRDFEQAYLMGLEGFGKKLKRKLRKIAKSKVFKAALVVGAGAVAFNYAAPALKAGLKSGKYKAIGKKLLSKGAKLVKKRLAPPPATPDQLQPGIEQAIMMARSLPQDQAQQALLESPAFQADSAFKAAQAVSPMIADEYLRQGYNYDDAQEMAQNDSRVIGAEVTKNFIEKAPENGGAAGLAIPAGLLAFLMLKG